MKKVMTAINHPVINQYFRNNGSDFIVEYDDIQYQEGLLEILRNSIPDALVLNEQLPGSFDRRTLIEEIRQIDKYFKIIIIVAKEDREFSNYLSSKGIFDILINDQAEISSLIEAINREDKVIVKVKKEIPVEVQEELQTLKKLVREKPKVIKKNVILEPALQIQRQEIIVVSGTGSTGKSDLVTQMSVTLTKNSKAKVLVIDLDVENPSLDLFFGIPKEPLNVETDLGSGKNSCLNHMVDSIDKNRFDSNVFDELVIKHKKLNNLHILTGSYSLYVTRNILNETYYNAILNKAKELYDFIFIDVNSSVFFESHRFAITNASKIFFAVEGNCSSLRRALQMLDIYTNIWEVRSEKIQLIVNKYNQYSLDKEVIKEIVGSYKICQYIKYDSKHEEYLNKKVPMLFGVPKKEQEIYLKILENFNFVRKRSIFERLFKSQYLKVEEKEIKQLESSDKGVEECL